VSALASLRPAPPALQPLPKSVTEAESANPKPGNLWRMTPTQRRFSAGLTGQAQFS